MPAVVDLKPWLLKTDHDPTDVMSSDPSQFLGQNGVVGELGTMLLALPKMAIQVVVQALTDPTALLNLVEQFPNFFSDIIGGATLTGGGGGLWGPIISEIVGLPASLLSLGDVGTYFGGLEQMLGLPDFTSGLFDPAAAVLTFVTDMINPTALLSGGGVFAPLLGGLGLGSLTSLLSFLNPTTLLSGGGIFGPLLNLIPGLSTLAGLGSFLNPTTLLSGGGIFGPLLSLIPGLSTLSGLGSFLNPSSFLSGGGIFAPLLSLLGLGNVGALGSFLSPALGSTGTNVFSPLLGGLGLSSLTSLLGFLSPTGLGGIFAPLASGGQLLTSLIPVLGVSQLQPLIDAISSGFGGGGGLGFGGLQSLLSAIPGVQQIIDALGLGLGGTGSGFTATGIQSMLSTLLNGFGPGASILSQIIGVIPGLTGGLTGLGGLGSIFTDLTHLLGSPTGLGGGSPTLPGIGSIPLLGGLLSGGSLIGSLIPGLDASKIISGVLGLGIIPGLPASQITSGAFSLAQLPTTVLNSVTGVASSLLSGVLGVGLIPNLPASILTSGVLGTGLIPGIDASKIVSGQLPIGMITNLASSLAGLLPVGTWQNFLDSTLGVGSGIGSAAGLTSMLQGLLPIGTFQQLLDGVLGGTNNTVPGLVSWLGGTNTTATNANSNAVDALTQLTGLATGLLGAGNGIPQVVSFLLGTNSTATGAQSQAAGLQGELQSIFDGVLGGSGGTPTAFTGFLNGLLGGNSPINALNIFGLIQPGNVGQIGIGQVGSTVVNLLTNPNFQGTGALDGGGIWNQDPTVGYAGVLGSAKVTATGATKELLSNSVAVTPGQTISLSGATQWAGVAQTASTTPIQIAVNTYLAGAGVGQTVISSIGATPATSSWQLLSGTFTVPAGVDSIRMKLVVSADATAGNVWFTHLSLTKTGLLPTSLVNGLDPQLTGFTSNFASIFTSLTTFTTLTQFNSLLNVFGGSVPSATSLIGSFLTPTSTLNASNIGSGTIADSFVPGISSIVDNIVQNLSGLPGSGFSHPQANTALANTAASLVSVQAAVATLQTNLTAGVSVGDTFTTNGTSSANLGANWLSILSPGSSGHWGTPAGNAASWVPVLLNTNNVESINVWQGANAQSVTDLQTVTVILSGTGGNFLGATGHIDVWLRVSSGTTTFANATGIRCRWGADGSMSLTRFVNGVQAVLNSAPAGTVTAPGAGVNLTGVAGKSGTVRWFDMRINGTSVLTLTEVGSGSLIGTGNRGWGWGGRAEGLVLAIPPGQQVPPVVHQWNAADQPAA